MYVLKILIKEEKNKMNLIIRDILDRNLNRYRNACPANITDLVFKIIETNYNTQYKNRLRTKTKHSINASGGKFIKQHWNLQNIGREYNPDSSLIKSYTKHSN